MLSTQISSDCDKQSHSDSNDDSDIDIKIGPEVRLEYMICNEKAGTDDQIERWSLARTIEDIISPGCREKKIQFYQNKHNK